MNRFAPVAVAASLLVACNASGWHEAHAGAERGTALPVGQGVATPGDMRYRTQYAASGLEDSDANHGFYGWSYLLASPVASPLAAARTSDEDRSR